MERMRYARYQMDVEKTLYRFLLGGLLGYLLGQHIVPDIIGPIRERVHSLAWCAEIDNPKPMIPRNVERSNIYIGMMSMHKNIDTRIQAAINTWAKHPGVTVEIFANNNGTLDPRYRHITSTLDSGVPIIQLPGVTDDVYPPQKKSFSMIKFMYDFYIKKYDWFVRLDDDAYLDFDKLEKLLSKINSSQPLYIGSAGFGRDGGDWVDKGENYCMGGPGMVFSKALLLQLGPKLAECLQEMWSEHEDIEVGRCVRKVSGQLCTVSWETKKIFYQNYHGGSYMENIKEISESELNHGVIFHANKEKEYQLRFHTLVLSRKINSLINKIARMEKNIRDIDNMGSNVNEAGVNINPHHRWKAIRHFITYDADSMEAKAKTNDNDKAVLVQNTNTFVREIQRQKVGPNLKLKEIDMVQSYYVVNPHFSADTISQIMFKYIPKSTRGGATETKKTLSVLHRKYFPENVIYMEEPTSIKPDLSSTVEKGGTVDGDSMTTRLFTEASTAVNFLMALSGRPDNFIRFINNFEETFLKRGENVNLVVAFFPESDSYHDYLPDTPVDLDKNQNKTRHVDNGGYISQIVSALQEKYPKQNFQVVTMKNGAAFSRGVGLQEATHYVTNDNDIVFFCDVDLVFSADILTHIRRNTIQGSRVYYPVFFSQYDPDVVYAQREMPPTHFRFSELDGFWRHFSYGMLSIYKSDFLSTSGYDLNIVGWGLEDIHLVNSVTSAGLDIFKSTEPSIIHVFHEKYCDPSLASDQLKTCIKSRAAHFGPKTLLQYLWIEPEIDEE